MDIQGHNNLPATKGDIERILAILETLRDPMISESPEPENKAFINLERRLAIIEKVSRAAAGTGLNDVPIDAETAATITGLAKATIKKYGAYRHIVTIKIGKKLQFSLKDCIRLVKKGSREAVIDCTTDMRSRRRKKIHNNPKFSRIPK
jgi:hypothetical protein